METVNCYDLKILPYAPFRTNRTVGEEVQIYKVGLVGNAWESGYRVVGFRHNPKLNLELIVVEKNGITHNENDHNVTSYRLNDSKLWHFANSFYR